jgi:hypothetical protein
LQVVNTSTSLASLVWSNESAADADFAGYNIYASTIPLDPAPSLVGNVVGPVTSFVVSGLSNNTTYYFVVRGEDAAPQESPNSPEATGTTGAVSNPNPPPPPPACPPPSPPNCDLAGGPPDGNFADILPGDELVLDLGPGNGILDDGPGYDLVYYERERPPVPTGLIQMDWVTVELSIDLTTWYVAFAWSEGNEGLAQNSNVAPYAINGGTNPDPNYCDLFAGASAIDEIRMSGGGPCPSWGGLWGAPPYQTGIAIDINGVIPPPTGEGYRYIRIRVRPDATQPAEIDTIERIN